MDRKLFDSWAENYDDFSKEDLNSFPFAGYDRVLARIEKEVTGKKGDRILDIGVGTGLLAARFYGKGYSIYGVDFSQRMLQKAEEKMPGGKFFCGDINRGLPAEVKKEKFDFIVSSYVLHHLKDKEKVEFLSKLYRENLMGKGKIIIGDIGFTDRKEMERCREKEAKKWDHNEYYLIAEDIVPRLKRMGLKIDYEQISYCGFILKIFGPEEGC